MAKEQNRKPQAVQIFPCIKQQIGEKKNHAFFIPKSIGPVLSLRIWKILITTSFSAPALDSPGLVQKSPNSRRWRGSVEVLLFKDATSQLLLFREAKAVREEEFQFNSIISGLYWYIILFHSGWIMLYFMSWSQYPGSSFAGTCLWLCDAGWTRTVWMVNTWTGIGLAVTRDVVFSCLWTQFFWIIKRITRHATGLGTVPGFESMIKT